MASTNEERLAVIETRVEDLLTVIAQFKDIAERTTRNEAQIGTLKWLIGVIMAALIGLVLNNAFAK